MKKIPTEDFVPKTDPHYHPSVFEENLTEHHPYPDFDKAVFSWIAPEYLQHPKTVRWWVIAAAVLFLSIIAEALTGNWTMLLATVVFAGVYYYVHNFRPPRHTKINISELGVKIGHRKIPYGDIECFWIIYNPPFTKRLFLRVKNQLISDLVLELENQDPLAVKIYLEKHLSEVTGMREGFTDLLLKLLKL
jgi:hypothetical protein